MAQNNCQLVVTGLQGKREVVTVAKNCTIDQLYDVVRQRCAATVSVDELRLVYGGSEMERGKGSTIEDFDIPNMGQIFMVIRLRGGVTLLWIHLEQPPTCSQVSEDEAKVVCCHHDVIVLYSAVQLLKY